MSHLLQTFEMVFCPAAAFLVVLFVWLCVDHERNRTGALRRPKR